MEEGREHFHSPPHPSLFSCSQPFAPSPQSERLKQTSLSSRLSDSGKGAKKKRHAKRWRGRKINDYRLSLPSAFSHPTNFTRTFFFRVFHTSESRANSYVLLMFIWLPRVCGLERNKSPTVKVAWLPLLRLSM